MRTTSYFQFVGKRSTLLGAKKSIHCLKSKNRLLDAVIQTSCPSNGASYGRLIRRQWRFVLILLKDASYQLHLTSGKNQSNMLDSRVKDRILHEEVSLTNIAEECWNTFPSFALEWLYEFQCCWSFAANRRPLRQSVVSRVTTTRNIEWGLMLEKA